MSGSISVRQLNLYVKSLLEGDPRLSCIAVTGEISNLKKHYASGHWYFTLKDANASVRCIMFRSSALKVTSDIYDGITVTVIGRISLYERDGQYQLYAEEMTVGAEGELALKFEITKKKLLAEGLFDNSHKRPLPDFPKRIAVITSDTGAAVQDILNITERRFPLCEIILCPVAVQGSQAVPEMLDALERVYRISSISLIIIGRGGGSAEELSAFNDEQLARMLYEAPVPVISAVGHETDFSICDFVADCRASTPSAAAELAVPDSSAVFQHIYSLKKAAVRALERCYAQALSRYEKTAGSPYLKRPRTEICERREEMLDRLTEKLKILYKHNYDMRTAAFSRVTAKLDALSPLKVMLRGFVGVNNKNGAVKTINEISEGERLSLIFHDGYAECTVEEIRKNV